MKIQEYIASGILEQYAIGDLSSSQNAEVENMLKKHPELRVELQKIELTMEAFFDHLKVDAEPSTKEKMISRAQGTNKTSGFFNVRMAASISIVIVSSLLSVFLYMQWSNSEQELISEKRENQRIADNLKQTTEAKATLDKRMAVLRSPDIDVIKLEGTDNAPGSEVLVYWNRSSNDVYLGFSSLSVLSKEQQYQLWAIIDGNPVSLGVFDQGNDLWAKMERFEGEPAAFAITVEVRGGSKQPTLETMQVLGNVIYG